MNRVGERLPLLPGERLLEPLTELLTLLQAVPRGRQVWGHMIAFTRERRHLGFSLLEPGQEKTEEENESLRQRLYRRSLILGSTLVAILFLWVAAEGVPILLDGWDAYFTGLLDRLSDWWQGLRGGGEK